MASTESPYVLNFKTQRGTIITVRADTHTDLAERTALLSFPIEDGPDQESVVDMIRAIEESLAGAAPASGGSSAQSQPQASLTPPCKVCGASTNEKSGTGRKGPWKGYFCSANKDHEVQWAKV